MEQEIRVPEWAVEELVANRRVELRDSENGHSVILEVYNEH